jgi:flagellar protein FlbD
MDIVIILTRLGGHEVAVNPDLIERAEPTPDTVLTMVDGHKIVVAEDVDEVVALVRDWRACVVARARAFMEHPEHRSIGHHPSQYPAPLPPEDDGDELAEQASLDASLAQVLRMPPRRGE